MAAEARQNESALVCAAQRGDREALQLLLRRNWAWLRGLAYSIVSDADEVDDVLQDICVRVIGKIGTLREPERFRPWLAVLARRQALRHREQRSRRPVLLKEELAELKPDQHAQQLLDNMERTEQYRQILDTMRALPDKYREVFVLEHINDLTYRQIAEILDVPVTTVQIRLVRARRMIYDQVIGKSQSCLRGRET